VSLNLAGLPGVSVPCGMAGGLPVGLQWIGKPFQETDLLSVAAATEALNK
jgi:aspartyl-tRNA(Asn)/glutamyl-tRNA(Gln) amidotransferase subunit A